MASPRKPTSEDDWLALHIEISQLFDGAPIDEEDLFAGRQADVEASMDRFIEDTERTFRDAYKQATRSNQDNYFEQSLLACALAKTDDEGFFTANDVVEPYSAIMKERKRHAHFEKHMRRFSTDEGGNILIKRGGDRQQRFRFADSMMQPYVIIKGINNRMVTEDAKAILLKREQGELPI